jgi:hypothetical protein
LTFTPRDAEDYFASRLQLDTHELTHIDTGRKIYIDGPVLRARPWLLQPRVPGHGWLFDRLPDPAVGPVVKQQLYMPENVRRVTPASARIQMPVFFIQRDGTVGITLARATDAGVACLRGANDVAPIESKTTIMLVVNVRPSVSSSASGTQDQINQWPDRALYKKQIDQRIGTVEMTIGDFAIRVGNFVRGSLSVRVASARLSCPGVAGLTNDARAGRAQSISGL